jgi:hypothetical protein
VAEVADIPQEAKDPAYFVQARLCGDGHDNPSPFGARRSIRDVTGGMLTIERQLCQANRAGSRKWANCFPPAPV